MDVDKVKRTARKLSADVDDFVFKNVPGKYTKPLADKKIRPVYIVLTVTVLTIILFLFVAGQQSQNAIVNIVGFVYPMYMSLKALQSSAKADDTQWLTYWVVIAFFNCFESISDVLFDWIPWYYSIKIGFLVWCFLPQTKGAQVVYKRVLSPALDKYMPAIDEGVAQVAEVASTVRRKVIEDDDKTD